MNDTSSPHFYGRRKGRPVRSQKQKLLENLLPHLKISIKDQKTPVDPSSFFSSSPQEVWLEIGFGAGEHLAHLAANHPECGLIGSEVFLNGIASFLEHYQAHGLKNVRLFPDDVRLLLGVLKPQSLHKIIVLFPDPWPKARHNKRRLIQEETLALFSSLLVEGGELRLASDHKDYIQWMLEEIKKVPSLALPEGETHENWKERPSSWPATRYEEKAAQKGITSTYLSLRKK